jgi:hypothetical protein
MKRLILLVLCAVLLFIYAYFPAKSESAPRNLYDIGEEQVELMEEMLDRLEGIEDKVSSIEHHLR